MHGLARLIQARIGRTTLRHIRSHTGLPDENSRGNERADALAKEGREAALSKPLKWLTQGEEQVIFWSDGKHVVGDIRAEVKRILVRRRLANWSRQSHQGRIAREVGPSILTYCAEIRRMAWKLRSPGMQMFLLGSLCQVLPPEVGLTVGRRWMQGPAFGVVMVRSTTPGMFLSAGRGEMGRGYGGWR